MTRNAVVVLCAVLLLAVSRPAPAVRAQDEPPVVGDATETWSLATPGAFRAWTCMTSRNSSEYGPDGLSQSITGRCNLGAQSVGMRVDARDVTLGDGEVSIGVRIPEGLPRARLALYARVQPDGARGYVVQWEPARGFMNLRKLQAGGASVSLAMRGDLAHAQPDSWTRVGMIFDGPRIWVTLDGQAIMAASDEEHADGTIAVSTSRIGALESDVRVLSIWRDLRVAPLTAGIAERGPRIKPPPAPDPALVRHELREAVAQDDLRTGAVIQPTVCATGANTGTYSPDGLNIRVTGKCFDTSTTASMLGVQPDVTIGDGEARVEFRVEDGWERARVSLWLLDPQPEGSLLGVSLVPSRRAIAIISDSPEGPKILAEKTPIGARLSPNSWTSLAIQRHGDRVWAIVNDEAVLVADGASTTPGLAVPLVGRLGSPDDGDAVVATLRNFSATTIEGADPEHGVVRAPRPIVDPRYERLLTFIRSELAEDPGTDAAAAERREIGRALLEMIAATQVNLTVGPLPSSTAARFTTFQQAIVVDEVLMTYTPHVATMLLLHEVVHANQQRIGQPARCVDRETEAAMWQARLWRAWFGPEGKQPPGDDVESIFSTIVRLDNRGRLRDAVETVYHDSCSGR
jgi:hypothetical protein